MRQKAHCACFLIFFLLLTLPPPSQAAHGISIDGKLKYPAGFTHFDYTSEKAQVGGDLVLHDLGSFDKMNPLHPERNVAYRPRRTGLRNPGHAQPG